MKEPRQHRSVKRPYTLILICIIMVVAVVLRLLMIYLRFDEKSGCGECLVGAAALSDAPFLVVWSAIVWLGFNLRIALAAWLCRVIAVVCVLLYIADVYVLHTFSTRLYITWVKNIGATPGFIVDHLKSSGTVEFLGFIFLLVVSLAIVVRKPTSNKRRPLALVFLTIFFALTVAANRFNKVQYVHAWVTENVFFTSQFSGISNSYSDGYLEPLAESFGSVPSCQPGMNKQADVIVLILESWSANHSALWGGGHNWTPALDRIAENSIRSSRFIAGGFNTNQGLAAIISGTPILSSLTSVFTRKPFEPAWGSGFTLPEQLAKEGYQTAFLTSGDLSFLKKADWLKHTGFAYVEDASHPVYEGHPRTHFNAAPDGVLFEHAIDYWNEKKNLPGPVGIVVESVSSHTPFVNPVTGERGEESVIRYMDTAAGDFFERLGNEGFFASGGVLVIVSDHRSMTVMRDEESRLFGPWAPALVPMLIYTESVEPFVTDKVFHQADIAPSLASYLTSEGCGYPDWKDLFDEQKDSPERCVFHASGTNVEQLIVYCDDGNGVIELDGDDSRFLEAVNLSEQKKIEVLKKVAYSRVFAQELTDVYLKREH